MNLILSIKCSRKHNVSNWKFRNLSFSVMFDILKESELDICTDLPMQYQSFLRNTVMRTGPNKQKFWKQGFLWPCLFINKWQKSCFSEGKINQVIGGNLCSQSFELLASYSTYKWLQDSQDLISRLYLYICTHSDFLQYCVS